MLQTKLHVDLQWINRISTSLPRFRKVKTDTFNCRCILCGDSKTSERKARFYFYTKKQQMNVFCQNCGYSHSFFKFMKDAFPALFEEYKRETLFDVFTSRKIKQNINVEKVQTLDKLSLMHIKTFKMSLTPILDLDHAHEAFVLLKDRAFTQKEMGRLYYSSDFKKTASLINSDAANNLRANEPRIIIPFVNQDGFVEMIQGRSIGPSSVKYVSIKANDDINKVYGLYEVDEAATVYAVEGPFDSLFVDNCIATCDANLTRADADVYIWDNQPRNKDVVKYMKNAIDSGKSVVIWPTSPETKQDINDLIMKGIDQKVLMKVIQKSTYKGLAAKAKFMQWKKV